MSMFDNLLEDDDSQKIKAKPFHEVQTKDETEILKWLNEVSQALMKTHTQRHHRLKANLAAYRGITYRQPHSRSTYRQTERIPTNRTERFKVNHLYDMTETKVSQMTRIKPAVEILPANQEFGDKNSARATKMLLDHLWYINDFDSLHTEIQRHKKIFGEACLFIEWDKDKGESHPEAGEMIIDEETGEPIGEAPDDLKVGDVDYRLVLPWRLLFQLQDTFKDTEYCFEVKLEHIDNVKKQYPSKASKIKGDKNVFEFDISTLENTRLEETAVVFCFHHKSTKFSPDGAMIKFTKDTILEKKKLPYSHGELPFERITDLDIPDVQNGVSIYEMIKPIQNMHDNLSTMLAKNIYLMGHAKWVMPKGAAKIDSLGNDNTVVQFQGPIAPQMVQANPNPPEAYNFRDKLLDEMNQIYAVHGVSRGQPPQGVTAGIALQFLNEQEAERASSEVSKTLAFIKRVARKTLAVAGDYYEAEDGRLLRILGNDNRYLIKHFDAADLHRAYDIRIQSGNPLAETKAGKMSRVIEVLQYAPGTLSGERIVELLDLGDIDKTTTLITEAVRSAESENEDLLAGQPVADPEPYEDHIVHWRVHTKRMQRRDFKEEVPPEIREIFKEHIMLTEFLMVQKAKENPLFQAKLAQLDLFPVFYREGFTPQSAQQQAAMVQGQANRGEQVSGQIPSGEAMPLPGEPKQGE